MRGTRTVLTAAALATTLGAWPASPAHAEPICVLVAKDGQPVVNNCLLESLPKHFCPGAPVGNVYVEVCVPDPNPAR